MERHSSELMKPMVKLGLAAKCLGIFPFRNVRRLADRQGYAFCFNLWTVHSLWNLGPVIVVAVVGAVACFGGAGFSSGNSDKEPTWDIVVFHIMLVITVVSVSITYTGSLTKASQMPSLLAGFKDVERKLNVDLAESRRLEKSIYLTLVLFLPSVGLYGTFLMPTSSMSIVFESKGGFLIKFMIICAFYYISGAVLYEVIFIYLVKVLKLLSTTNLSALRAHVAKPNALTSQEIEHHRRVQLELSALADVLSGVFHPAILSTTLGSASVAMIMAYVSASITLSGEVSSASGFPGLICVILLGKIVALIRATSSLEHHVEHELKKSSLDIGATLPRHLKKKMLMFHMQAAQHPIRLTAAEYAVLDTDFLKAILANMGTFLVILLQVKIDNVKKE